MPRKTTGISKVGDSFEVRGKVGGSQFSRRFPLGTGYSTMTKWREAEIAQRKKSLPVERVGGFAQAVAEFLKTETGRRARDFEDLLAHWTRAFEGKSRLLVTSKMVNDQLLAWKAQGVAASTLNHRRQALRTMFNRLEPNSPNPVDDTTPFKQPEPEPRAVPEEILDKVFEAMPDSVTKVRLLCIMHSGVRHSELVRIRPENVVLDGDAPHVFVTSGKGGRHRVVPLNERARGAYAAMFLFDAWGKFSKDSARKTWCCALHKVGLAEQRRTAKGQTYYVAGAYRPYDLRHRFATRLRASGADLADVQELLGHKNIQTTRRYAPVVAHKLVAAVNRIDEEEVKAS